MIDHNKLAAFRAVDWNQNLVFSIQTTCGSSVEEKEREIIELGGWIYNCEVGFLDSYQIFVLPVRRPKLTQTCMDHTGIQQIDVNSALPFLYSMERFVQYFAQHAPYDVAAWGDVLRTRLKRECEFHGRPYPYLTFFIDVQDAFRQIYKTTHRWGLEQAMSHAGLERKGDLRRAKDVAYNTALVFDHLKTGSIQ